MQCITTLLILSAIENDQIKKRDFDSKEGCRGGFTRKRVKRA